VPGAVGAGAEVAGVEVAGGFVGVVGVGCRCRSGLDEGEDSLIVGEGSGVLKGVATMAVGTGISEEDAGGLHLGEFCRLTAGAVMFELAEATRAATARR